MLDRMKWFITGFIAAFVLTGAVYAETGEKAIKAVYENIRLYIDNSQVIPADNSGNPVEPFIYDGTTYIPVRAVAKAFEKSIKWDGLNKSIYINTPPKKIYKQAEYGDVIGTVRTLYGYDYEHYGIYIGNNRVIHFNSITGKASDAVVIESAIDEYFEDGKYFVLDFKETKTYSPDTAVSNAKAKLGEKKYDLLNYNCEHFAIWCKTGLLKSYQVDGLSDDELAALQKLIDLFDLAV